MFAQSLTTILQLSENLKQYSRTRLKRSQAGAASKAIANSSQPHHVPAAGGVGGFQQLNQCRVFILIGNLLKFIGKNFSLPWVARDLRQTFDDYVRNPTELSDSNMFSKSRAIVKNRPQFRPRSRSESRSRSEDGGQFGA